jgi:site-specific recombinase XerD
MTTIAISRDDFDRNIDDYLDLRLKMNHQPSSVLAARKDLHVFSAYLQSKNIPSINGQTLLDFMSWLHTERKNCSGSINRKQSSIRMYIRHLALRGAQGANELPVAFLPRARDPYSGPVQTLEFEEVISILSAFNKDSVIDKRNFTLFSLIYALGLRLSEALGINLEDINVIKDLITIRGKGRKVRIIPLTDEVKNMLLDWIVMRKTILNSSSNHALFLSKKGKRLSPRMAEQAFKLVRDNMVNLTIARVVPHTLRHAFASHAIDGEADVLVLKTIMGHASIKTTEIYLHPSIKSLRKAVADHASSDILNELRENRIGVFKIQKRKERVA